MKIERDSGGQLRGFVAPTGSSSAVTLNSEGMLETIADPEGNTAEFEYNDGHLMTSHTPSFGCKQEYRCVKSKPKVIIKI